jgi:SNF2 family DNA or RNA helicase
VKKDLGGRTVTGLARPVNEHKQKFLDWMARFCVVMTKHSEAVRADLIIPEQDLVVEDLGVSDETIDDCIVRLALAAAALDPDGKLPSAAAVMHLALAEGAAEKIGWLMDQMDGTPVVLFAEYHTTLSAIRAALDQAKISYVYVDGSVTGDQRVECVRMFQEGLVPVFVGQIDAAGAAVNLFRANVSVAIDHSQRATSYAQALGRTCRRGQDRRCTHIDLVANPLQRVCLERLRAAEDFHLDLARVRAALDARMVKV